MHNTMHASHSISIPCTTLGLHHTLDLVQHHALHHSRLRLHTPCMAITCTTLFTQSSAPHSLHHTRPTPHCTTPAVHSPATLGLHHIHPALHSLAPHTGLHQIHPVLHCTTHTLHFVLHHALHHSRLRPCTPCMALTWHHTLYTFFCTTLALHHPALNSPCTTPTLHHTRPAPHSPCTTSALHYIFQHHIRSALHSPCTTFALHHSCTIIPHHTRPAQPPRTTLHHTRLYHTSALHSPCTTFTSPQHTLLHTLLHTLHHTHPASHRGPRSAPCPAPLSPSTMHTLALAWHHTLYIFFCTTLTASHSPCTTVNITRVSTYQQKHMNMLTLHLSCINSQGIHISIRSHQHSHHHWHHHSQ